MTTIKLFVLATLVAVTTLTTACDDSSPTHGDLTTVDAAVSIASIACARTVECGSPQRQVAQCENYKYLRLCGEGEDKHCNQVFTVSSADMDVCLADLQAATCREAFDDVMPESCLGLF